MDWFVFAFASAFFSAAAALSQKKVLFKIEAFDFSLIVSVIGLLFSIPFFFVIDFNSLSAQAILILYFKSLIGSLAFLCVMLVIKNFEISKALPLMVLTPGLIAIFAFLFLGDSLSLREVGGILLLMTGTYFLEVSDKENIFNSFRIIFRSRHYYYILIALILFTTSAILDRYLLTGYKFSPEGFMAFQQMFFAVNFLLIFLVRKKKPQLRQHLFNKSILMWIILIAILTIVYRYSQIEATKLAPVAMVISVKRISVFFSSAAGGKIFNERNLIIRTTAAAIMIAGTILLINY